MTTMLELFEDGKKVAEIPEEEFWSMTGPQKKAWIKAQELTGRTIGVSDETV